jgi:hypothetical protein
MLWNTASWSAFDDKHKSMVIELYYFTEEGLAHAGSEIRKVAGGANLARKTCAHIFDGVIHAGYTKDPAIANTMKSYFGDKTHRRGHRRARRESWEGVSIFVK